jgi:hypothetical protein
MSPAGTQTAATGSSSGSLEGRAANREPITGVRRAQWLQRSLVWVTFLGLLAVGLCIYQDYGYSWDEETSRVNNGLANYEYITTGDRTLLRLSTERNHGPAFEIALVVLEKGLQLDDTRTVYFMRHLVTFLLFYASVVVFYRMLRERFHSRLIGLAGAAALVLSPRIFADAFYNSKDLAFLAAYIFALATSLRYLRDQSTRNAILHALACGFLIDIRILGIVVPMLTVSLIAAGWYVRKRRGESVTMPWRSLRWYAGMMTLFVILFWPQLWRNPPGNFIKAFNEMRHYPWPNEVFYQGTSVLARELPWHYAPCWILITTPLLYTLLFVVGLGRFLVEACRRPFYFVLERSEDVAWAGAFLLPLLAVIGMHATIYDGWRHLYFIYPAFVFLAVLGFTTLYAGVAALSRRIPGAVALFLGCCALPLGITAWQMVHDHPYQNVYFNVLAGQDMQSIKSRYEMDYWGLSCREGLERLLALDPSPEIRVYPGTTAVVESLVMVPAEQRARVRFVSSVAEAVYYASHYREHRDEFPPERDFCTVRVGNTKLFVVHKLH